MLRVLIQTLKGLYDVLVSYLLIWILGFALVGFGIQLGIGALATALDYDTTERMWTAWSLKTGVGARWLRLGLMVPAWILALLILFKPVQALQPLFERLFDGTVQRFRQAMASRPATLGFIELSFSVMVTLLLIPFLFQPTLVRGWSASSWLERGVNLVDGSASKAFADSVVGLYRRLDAEPVVVADAKLQAAELERDFEQTPPAAPRPAGEHPMMDRWDPYIRRAARGDKRLFAYTKAFMYVESAGRQYALSRTGCAGLMQFCSPTARSGPFREIFGVGQVYTCNCKGRCKVPKAVRKALESADPPTVAAQADDFPCELTDARFDPDKAIRAGSVYVRRLGEAYGYNPYIMYVGYNSGPAVAKRLWRATGKKPEASLQEIEAHLPAALAPYYHKGSAARARSLVKTHLPKIARARDGYLRP